MKKAFLTLLAVVLTVALAHADFYIKQKTHTDAFEMMGQKQPAKDEIAEVWIGKGVLSSKTPQGGMVINVEQKKWWMHQSKNKSYIEQSLPVDMMKIMPSHMAALMPKVKITFKVTPTGQTKQIGAWSCSGYTVETVMMGMPMKQTIWAAENTPLDWKDYAEKIMPEIMGATMQGVLPQEGLAELKKIKGYPVMTEINIEMMGAKMRTVTEVLEISQKDAPAGTYLPPAGYTKKDKLSM